MGWLDKACITQQQQKHHELQKQNEQNRKQTQEHQKHTDKKQNINKWKKNELYLSSGVRIDMETGSSGHTLIHTRKQQTTLKQTK